jgi:putative endonuclease
MSRRKTPPESPHGPITPRKPWWRRWFGSRSERAAVRFFRGLGYRIVAQNVRYPEGELDLVALDQTTLVFVEVRSTESSDIERPAVSVDLAKQRRLSSLALRFLQKKQLLGHTARFDVLALSWPAGHGKPTIVHYPNAFEAVGRFQMFT